MTGKMSASDVYGSNLSATHPVSFVLPLQAAPHLLSQLTANPPSRRARPAPCGSSTETSSARVATILTYRKSTRRRRCFSPSITPAAHSALPATSHHPQLIRHGSDQCPGSNPWIQWRHGGAQTGGTTSRKSNPLAEWKTSIHATATNKLAPQLALENNPLSANPGSHGLPAGVPGILRLGIGQRLPDVPCASQRPGGGFTPAGIDQTCITCHNGSAVVSPPIPNVLAEMVAPKYGLSGQFPVTAQTAYCSIKPSM